MTKSLEAILEKVSRLLARRLDEIASLLEQLVDLDDSAVPRLSDQDWAEVDRRQTAKARYATEDEINAFFRERLA
jgi:hypothetical protein